MSRNAEFFHGTSIHRADGILHEGAKPSDHGDLGGGFYFSEDPSYAQEYAQSRAEKTGSEPVLLKGTLDVQNPARFANAEELHQKSWDTGYENVAQYVDHLFRKGHDAVLTGRTGVTPKHGAFRPTNMREAADGPWTDLT